MEATQTLPARRGAATQTEPEAPDAERRVQAQNPDAAEAEQPDRVQNPDAELRHRLRVIIARLAQACQAVSGQRRIQPGDRIWKQPGTGWCHISCL